MTETSKWSLQKLVDEHAIMGMENVRIREHLIESHGIAKSTPIPVPSKRARMARNSFLRTGVMETHLLSNVISSRPSKNVNDDVGVVNDPSQPLKPLPSLEEMQEIMNKVALKMGISAPIVTMHEQTIGDEENESNEKFLEAIYVSRGQTLLDRIISGYVDWLKSENEQVNFAPASNFHLMQKIALGMEKDHDISKRHGTYIEDFDQGLFASILPWFTPGEKTLNLQITSEMAEIFFAARMADTHSWQRQFKDRPIFIDIAEPRIGVRTLSGIFLRYLPDLDTFGFLAVVEWSGQGYEAIIHGELNNLAEASVYNSSGIMDQEILGALYDDILTSISKIAGMTCMYYETLAAQKQPFEELKVHTGSLGAAQSKKERNKEKTHSYFRVKKLVMPKNRFGHRGPIGNSWSLDHIITVSGHFRWQPYGTGRTKHKLIFIESYEKGEGERIGPDIKPIINALH